MTAFFIARYAKYVAAVIAKASSSYSYIATVIASYSIG